MNRSRLHVRTPALPLRLLHRGVAPIDDRSCCHGSPVECERNRTRGARLENAPLPAVLRPAARLSATSSPAKPSSHPLVPRPDSTRDSALLSLQGAAGNRAVEALLSRSQGRQV